MNDGFINEDYLSKNIKFIEYYANEEKEKLNKICQELQKFSNYYNSTNQTLISKQIDEIRMNTEKLEQKRKKYIEILSKVIVKYNIISEKIKQKSIT